MRIRYLTIAAIGAAFVASGCGVPEDVRYVANKLNSKSNVSEEGLGGGAPLVVPPGFGLRPPTTRARGQARGTERLSRTVLKIAPEDRARIASPNRKIKPGERTAGEVEVLRKAGLKGRVTTNVVRKTIDIETKRNAKDSKTFVNKVLKYDPKARAPGDRGKGKDTKGRNATLSRPEID
jgi:hypothetical protein